MYGDVISTKIGKLYGIWKIGNIEMYCDVSTKIECEVFSSLI